MGGGESYRLELDEIVTKKTIQETLSLIIHSVLVVSTSTMQLWGLKFESHLGFHLHGVYIFSLCLDRFPMGILQRHGIGSSYLIDILVCMAVK